MAGDRLEYDLQALLNGRRSERMGRLRMKECLMACFSRDSTTPLRYQGVLRCSTDYKKNALLSSKPPQSRAGTQ
jgi:hypothetical protein